MKNKRYNDLDLDKVIQDMILSRQSDISHNVNIDTVTFKPCYEKLLTSAISIKDRVF